MAIFGFFSVFFGSPTFPHAQESPPIKTTTPRAKPEAPSLQRGSSPRRAV